MTDRELFEKACEVLRSISLVGGNLPDDRLESRTGPNDAVSRGIMLTSARNQANSFLFVNGQQLSSNTYFKPTAEQVRARGRIGGTTMEDAKRALEQS